ncbi:HEAT repeat domain-containing protein [Actinomadura scrupuli]|uniref:HEAT repeat domain-containing protein n=1 Tax=Actinomadura scrupuli TaxID=559629 RepID=UPI003D980017
MTTDQIQPETTTDQHVPAELEGYLRHPDPAVRRAAAGLLAGDPRDAGDTLAWALADTDDQVRRIAADALRVLPEVHIGSEGVQALLLAASGGRDAHVRDTAAETLRLLAESAEELYTQGLHDGEAHLRVEAVLGLVELRAVARVGESADDPVREVRVAVAQGLGRLGTETGVAALAQLITDHDPVVRMAAIEAAAELGVPEALASRVVTAIAHTSWQVRKRAAVALGAAPPDVAINPLIRALGDRIVDVRRAAVRSLERWADRPEVAGALTAALTDPDPGVRTQVRWALA